MQVYHVYIDDLRFTFVEKAPVDEFKERVVAASRADGAFVPILRSSRPPSEVFVTSQTKVRIETTTLPHEPLGESDDTGDGDAFWFDFDSLQ
jgi:hypothetical protein